MEIYHLIKNLKSHFEREVEVHPSMDGEELVIWVSNLDESCFETLSIEEVTKLRDYLNEWLASKDNE